MEQTFFDITKIRGGINDFVTTVHNPNESLNIRDVLRCFDWIILLSGLANIMCGFGLQEQQFKDVVTKVNIFNSFDIMNYHIVDT
jgi:hypothetical protein